ncbi:hypothetical protein RclHR1_02000004 [Rhizophagus clarus]|uniref:Uncharacterized protein n=1 Tax=Rhizophagus clarus TaxID=94130 RepID=A0A2Z6QPT8_9GLOM|nr:hypothetical protein RclHR1_02000004 [Rhizophagus clarus]GES99509.1 hypothetical protein GLOIN_2v1767093 [Rhizophagus clarus]
MSTNRPSRHHGFRGYGAADHDRLKRSLLQPVQSWERKWQYPSNGAKGFKIMKWVKSDRKITFNDDDDDDLGSVTTPARQPIIEDTPTPTASIIQPPTEASTPQPSETEPDSTNFLRPLPHLLSIPKAPSLLREASQASFTSVSTPGETITTNNNNTPHDIESSVGNSPEMEDEEEPMEDIITSQQMFQKNDKANDDNMEFKEKTKQVNDNINISNIYNKQTSISSGIFDKNQGKSTNNYNERVNQNEEDDDDDDDDDVDDDEEDEEEYMVQNDEYIVVRNENYNGPTEEYDGQGEDYDHVEDYSGNIDDDDDYDYGERADEYGNQASNEYNRQANNDYNNQTNNNYVNQANNDYSNQPNNNFDNQTSNDFDNQANNNYDRTNEYRINEYNTRNSEFGSTGEYEDNEYLGRTSEFGGQNEDEYEEALSDFDKQPNEYTDLHIKFEEQQSNIQSQISEYPSSQNPYQEHEVIDFMKHDKEKDVQENNIEQGQFNLDVFTKNIQDS